MRTHMEKLRTSLLLPAELSEIVAAYLRTIEDSGLENPFISGIVTLLTADLTKLNQAITAVRINQLVDDVAEADAIRDDLFIGFRDMVDTHKRRRDPALIAAYEVVWPLIEKAGVSLYKLGYTAQSGQMEALFAELDNPDQQAAIATMNATGIYAELKQAQADFTALYQSRLNADSDMNYPTLGEAKSVTIPHVNALLDSIDILDQMEPDTHTALIDKLDVITSSIMSTARARKTRGENEPEMED